MNPLKHMYVTSPFGVRVHPVHETKSFHSGVDLRALYEDAYAIADGTIEIAQYYKEGIGNCVVINHGSFMAVYGHLDKFNVKVGQLVSEGDVVATTGNTGTSTAPHLHFEIREDVPGYVWHREKDGRYENAIDPIEFLNRPDYSNAEIQTKLKEKGYYTDVVDGNMGPNSRQAIKEFQTDSYLDATGYADNITCKKLFEEELDFETLYYEAMERQSKLIECMKKMEDIYS